MRVRTARSIVWMRVSSGVKGTAVLAVVVLPFGRPGLRLPAGADGHRGDPLGACGGFFLCGTHDLLDLDGERPSLLGADQRQREEGQPRHRFAIQAGKEAIQPMGVLAGFGHHRFVTAQEIGIRVPEEVRPEKEPEQIGPRQGGGEEALDGPIAATRPGPARDPAHGDPTGHGQQGQRDPAELAQRRRRQRRCEAAQECYTVHHRLLSSLRCGCLQDTQRYDKSLLRATSVFGAGIDSGEPNELATIDDIVKLATSIQIEMENLQQGIAPPRVRRAVR